MSQPTNKSFASLKIQLILIFSAVALFFFAMAVFRTDQLLFSDRLGWIENQSRLQVSSLNQNLRNYLYRQRKIINWNAQELMNKNQVQWAQLEDVQSLAVAHLNKNALVVDFFAHRDSKEAAKFSSWQALQIERAMGRIDFSEGQDVFIKPLSVQKDNYVFVAYKTQDRVILALLDNSVWQAALDSQKQGASQLALWTRLGLTVANSTSEYFGQQVEEDPIFTEIQKTENNNGLGIYRLSKTAQVFAYYEHIDGTNLFAVSSMPLKELSKGRWAIVMQIGFLGLGLILLCIAGVLLVLKPFEKNYERLRQEIRNENLRLATNQIQRDSAVGTLPSSPLAPGASSAAIDEKLIQAEKMQAYSKVSSALGHELSGSVSAILGFAQRLKTLPRSSASNSDEAQSVDQIQKEARHIRQVMERLLSFSGETVQPKTNLVLNGPLQNALKMIEPVLSFQGIQLETDFKSTAERQIGYQALTKAFDCLLRNAVEAVDRCQKKKIKIRTWDDHGDSWIEILDTGSGIPAEIQSKAFDPFFSTKSPHQHIGLGLATAYGIFKEHGADIEIQSPIQQSGSSDLESVIGTSIRIHFPSVLAGAKVPSAPLEDQIQQIENELGVSALDNQEDTESFIQRVIQKMPPSHPSHSAGSAQSSSVAPTKAPPAAPPTTPKPQSSPSDFVTKVELSSPIQDLMNLTRPEHVNESDSKLSSPGSAVEERHPTAESSEEVTRLNVNIGKEKEKSMNKENSKFELTPSEKNIDATKTQFSVAAESSVEKEIDELLALPDLEKAQEPTRISSLNVDMAKEASSPEELSEFSKTDIGIEADLRVIPATLPKAATLSQHNFIDTPRKTVSPKRRSLEDFTVEIRRANKRPDE